MYYIQEVDKQDKIKKLFNIIKIDGNKLIIPIQNSENIKENKLIKLVNKTNKVLSKSKSNKIILSKLLKNNDIFFNNLFSYGYDIVEGKWLFEGISYKVIDYILNKKQLIKEECSISVLVNHLTDYTLQNINIVTNHIEKFKKIEENIYNENGLMITVTNNKKKSLSNSKVILNIDFPKELINKYNINEEAIIVNIYNDITINKKRFNGVIINDYEININSSIIENSIGEDYNKYNIKDIYESEFYYNMPFKDFGKKIEKDGLQIVKLYGLNNEI